MKRMKVKSFLKRNPEVELEIIDMYFRAYKEGVKIRVSDVEELMKYLTEESTSPIHQPNAMAIYNYFR